MRTVVVVALDLLVRVQLVECITGEILGCGCNGEVTINFLQFWQGKVTKVTGHGNGSRNSLQVVKVDFLQQGVVQHTELAVDFSQVVERQTFQVVVGINQQRRANGSQTVEVGRVKAVVRQKERAVDRLQIGNRDFTNILDGQVRSPYQAVQLNGCIVTVERQNQRVRNSVQAQQIDGSDVLIIVDVQKIDFFESKQVVNAGQSRVGQCKRRDIG